MTQVSCSRASHSMKHYITWLSNLWLRVLTTDSFWSIPLRSGLTFGVAACDIPVRGIFIMHSGSLKMKLNDKQMKSLFKKWYNIEETHGDLNSQNQVKLEATSFVQRSAAAIGRKQTK
mmetsp:Transcript_1390/g.2130  ORF Transcript_1390/g.2130 Transcript_1390/m.2130 type:complete len:118 (+) Transcript_1390:1121-1474(+)